MASIKNFKKELVYTYGALLDECYIVEMVCPKADREKLQALCQEIEQAYDDMADRLGSKDGKRNGSARQRSEEGIRRFGGCTDGKTPRPGRDEITDTTFEVV